MKFMSLAILGALLVGASSCVNTNNSLKVSELHQKSNGSYLIHGNCYSKSGEVTISDSSGSVSASGQTICYGTYGAARVVKEGTNTRVISFTPIKVVRDTYRIEKFLPNNKALITKEGTSVEVPIVGQGFSNYVIETSKGFERL